MIRKSQASEKAYRKRNDVEKSFKKLGEKPGGAKFFFNYYLFIFSYLPGRYIGLKKSARATRRASSLGEFPRELKPRRRRRARRRHHEHPGHARLGGRGIFGLRGAAEPPPGLWGGLPPCQPDPARSAAARGALPRNLDLGASREQREF